MSYQTDEQRKAALLQAAKLLEYPELLGETSLADRTALAYSGLVLERLAHGYENPARYTGGRPALVSRADRETLRFRWLNGEFKDKKALAAEIREHWDASKSLSRSTIAYATKPTAKKKL